MRKVAENCYIPANEIILDLILKNKGKFKVTFSLTGLVINQFRLYAPEVLESFKKLAETGMVEFLAETESHSLASIKTRSEFEHQVNAHKAMVKEFLGVETTSFRNTELIYSDQIGSVRLGVDETHAPRSFPRDERPPRFAARATRSAKNSGDNLSCGSNVHTRAVICDRGEKAPRPRSAPSAP